MSNQQSYRVLLSPLFIFSLFVLLLNDFLLKQQFSNALTGKLSDFAGLFVFALFFAAFFPHRRLAVCVSTAVIFTFWKSPFSQSLIEFWNATMFFSVRRVVDSTDLLALSVLPFSYFYSEMLAQKPKTFAPGFTRRGFAVFVVILSVFAFTATSTVDPITVSLDDEYQIRLTETEIENILRRNDKISDLKITRRAGAGSGSNQSTAPPAEANIFVVIFKLKEKVCDTPDPIVGFIIEREKEVSGIKAASFEFVCQGINEQNTAAKTQFKPELKTIFEREVIEKLRQNSPQ